MAIRTAIKEFGLANPLYAGASVNFWTINGSGVKTAVLATLYASDTGLTTVSNPQVLDSEGKFEAPVYIEVASIGSVSGIGIDDHDTGIIYPTGSFRGNWATATLYYPGDTFIAGAAADSSSDVYIVNTRHTSGTFATDVGNDKTEIMVDVSALADLFDVPAVTALNYIRGNAGGTVYENRTALQTLKDLYDAVSAETAPVMNDEFYHYDLSTTTFKKLPLSTLLTVVSPFGYPVNLALDPSVGGGALTMTAVWRDGSTLSAANAAYVPFISATASNGQYEWVAITSPIATTISSGSAGGHNSGLKQYLYWYAINNAGTVELAWSSKWFGQHGIVSTTAEGGGGAADSGTTMYSTTARAGVPFRCVGYTEDTQATAGTWATEPSAVHLAPFTHPVVSFSAHKNGSNQSGVVSSTDTKVTFGTELYDNGGLFDAVSNNRWVPPPGTIQLNAQVFFDSAMVDQSVIDCKIFKNGVEFKTSRVRGGGTGSLPAFITIQDESNGTDYYEIFAYHETASNEQINGLAIFTYVFGSWSPGRS